MFAITETHNTLTSDFDLATCFHGGDVFNLIGADLQHLERRHSLICADALDAWFPPSPRVTKALEADLAWLIQTAPPVHASGFVHAVATSRGILPECILHGAGSSDLIYRAFQSWLLRDSRALIIDPSYGEYQHILARVIGCTVDRITLSSSNDFLLDVSELTDRLERTHYDLVVIVNPNNPSGQLLAREDQLKIAAALSPQCRLWIDEAYIDFMSTCDSLELDACALSNVFVVKSMSKVYALSGVRAAYVVGNALAIDELRQRTPPWAISVPGQLASIVALCDNDYYRSKYDETLALGDALNDALRDCESLRTIYRGTPWVLIELSDELQCSAEAFVDRCRTKGLLIRNAASMGRSLAKRYVRISVKDRSANQKISQIIRHVADFSVMS